MFKLQATLTTTLLATAAASAAWAQSPEPASAPAPAAATAPLGATEADIVVTAQKRVERLQDVPLSVVALTGAQLDTQAITNFEEVELPGFKAARGGRADTIVIRGVGSGQNIGFEQSAPLYVDGIYYGRGRVQRLAFMDIARLEVLRGPQPTYLGKNAIAGALNITTATPTDTLQGYGEVSYEVETDEVIGSGAISGPITDTLAGRIAFRVRESQGYVRNSFTGDREPEISDLLGRAALRWTPIEALTVRLTGYVGRNEDVGRNSQPILCSAAYRRNLQPASADDCALDFRKASFGEVPDDADSRYYFDGGGAGLYNKFSIWGINLQMDYEFGNGITLTSLTGYYDYENRLYTDSDQAVSNFGNANFTENYSQISQELRILSPQDGRLTWFAGAYFDHSRPELRIATSINNLGAVPGSPFFNNPALTGSGLSDLNDRQEGWALFGEAAYRIVDPLTLKFGMRYEQVNKSEQYFSCDAALFTADCEPGSEFAFEEKVSDNKWQPAATLEYRPADDILLYFSFKKGFKAGGFSQDGSGGFGPENVTAYEFGAKTQFFDRRATLNVALFRANYSDLQVSAFDAETLTTFVRNAASSVSQGIEAELRVVPIKGLTLSASVAYLDSFYSDFPDAPCYALQTPAQGCVMGRQDLTGAETPYAPDYSGTAGFVYERALGKSLKFAVGMDVFFTDDFLTLGDNNPNARVPGYEKLNARVAVGSAQDRWEIALVGRNLTDVTTTSFRNIIPQSGGSVAGFVDLPFTLTLQGRVRF